MDVQQQKTLPDLTWSIVWDGILILPEMQTKIQIQPISSAAFEIH